MSICLSKSVFRRHDDHFCNWRTADWIYLLFFAHWPFFPPHFYPESWICVSWDDCSNLETDQILRQLQYVPLILSSIVYFMSTIKRMTTTYIVIVLCCVIMNTDPSVITYALIHNGVILMLNFSIGWLKLHVIWKCKKFCINYSWLWKWRK